MKGGLVMLTRKRLSTAGIIFVGLAMGMFLVSPTIAERAIDAHLVKIMPDQKGGGAKGMYLNPEILNITKNNIVVWMNGIEATEVQVVFQEGKTCRDVTANPNLKVPGFFLDSRNCYVTSFIPYSSTTTLQFINVGSYDYEVMTEDGKLTAKGKIVVRD